MIPPRDITERYLARAGHGLDIVFDIDLGELVPGHHVVLRGIDLGHTVNIERWRAELENALEARKEQLMRDLAAHRFLGEGFHDVNVARPLSTLSAADREVVATSQTEPEMHYEFVPGLQAYEDDEKGTAYEYWQLHISDDAGTRYLDNNIDVRGDPEGGAATHGRRNLGGRIPESATRLFIDFEPSEGWEPPEPWTRRVVVDLKARPIGVP